jgi:hypothetical protein
LADLICRREVTPEELVGCAVLAAVGDEQRAWGWLRAVDLGVAKRAELTDEDLAGAVPLACLNNAEKVPKV